MAASYPAAGPAVVKVGGSLFDLSDLGDRLESFLAEEAGAAAVVVPGGGPTADVIRILDRCHSLGEDAAHWLALQALTLNAYFLQQLLKDRRAVVTADLTGLPALWGAGKLPILDALAFARSDKRRPGCLPHRWTATSDALAARVAVLCGAHRLILLKSCSPPAEAGWDAMARQNYLDPWVEPTLRAGAAEGLQVEGVNFRQRPWRATAFGPDGPDAAPAPGR